MSGGTRGLLWLGAMAAGFMPYTSGIVDNFKMSKTIDPNANRKARKERARMLTRQREEEMRAQRLSQKN